MNKIMYAVLLCGVMYHGQSFCPRGQSHHLKRLNSSRHWSSGQLIFNSAGEMVERKSLIEAKKCIRLEIKCRKEAEIIKYAINKRISHYKQDHWQKNKYIKKF